jgi:hypothetical protein
MNKKKIDKKTIGIPKDLRILRGCKRSIISQRQLLGDDKGR